MTENIRLSHSGEQRETGRQHVFDAIRNAGNIARIDIARATGVSPATVTAITSELIDANLIEEIRPDTPPTAAKRGRPRVALKVKGSALKIAGIKVSFHAISAMVVDFEGNSIVDHEMALTEGRMEPEQLAQAIVKALEETCAKGGFEVADIAGVGIGIAGLVDAPNRSVHWSSSLTKRNVNLGAYMDAVLPCHVYIDNDANLVAMAEQSFGLGRNVSDFIVITIEHGVGMGIVINNDIYRGTRGCGAEFGHTKVQLEGALCQCGQRGCLEAYVGDYALLREANIISTGQPKQELAALFGAAQSGNQMAASIFDRAGRMFAMGLANVINIFDPKLVILAGARMSFDYLYADKVIEEMRRSVVQTDAPLPEVRIHKWGDLMWAKGAAAYAMEQVSALKIKELAANAG
ncbi:ROK family protein [Aestuariibius sp. HNIBRBA575]|uniref:ROK family transcriptional regulator n=1 Tax=Aestuariibius sp. HNIBRBA575 TaxID=3233343 RepID=UPI0034A4ADD2